MQQPKDYEQAYCSIPDEIQERSHTARWIQRKFGKINGPCYWHDIDGDDERFLTRLHQHIRIMEKVELEALAFDVVKDAQEIVKFHSTNKHKFLYKLLIKFVSFNNSK